MYVYILKSASKSTNNNLNLLIILEYPNLVI